MAITRPSPRRYISTIWFLCISFVALNQLACAQNQVLNPVRQRFPLKIASTTFMVEVAATDAERQTGLMHRTELRDDQGMLFVFAAEEYLSFWMKNTLLPLSIAYISSSGQIKEIHDMKPLTERSVSSQHIVKYALEVPLGAFERLGVKVGDYLILDEFQR